jgi:hypothetical protein
MTFDRVESGRIARDNYIKQMMDVYKQREANLGHRKVEFLKADPHAGRELGLILGTGTLSGAVAGGVVGGIVGGVLGAPGGPLVSLVGVGIGIPIGAAIGIAIAGGVATYRLYPSYQEYCKTANGTDFNRNLTMFLKDESVLAHLVCPITQLPVIEGVRTPDGQLFEKSKLEEWMEKSKTNPMTGAPLKKEDIRPDVDASFESNKAFSDFLKANRELTKTHAPQLVEGYDKLIRDLREGAISIHNRKLIVLQKQMLENKISYEQFSKESIELANKYFNL